MARRNPRRIKRRLRRYRVRSGDNYFSISQRLFGTDGFAAVLKRLNDGVTLQTGMNIKTNVGGRAPVIGTAAALQFGLSPSGVGDGVEPGGDFSESELLSPIQGGPPLTQGITTRELQGTQPLARSVTGGLPVSGQQFPDLTSPFAEGRQKVVTDLQKQQRLLATGSAGEVGGPLDVASDVQFAVEQRQADVQAQIIAAREGITAQESQTSGVFQRDLTPGQVVDGQVVVPEGATSSDLQIIINESPTDHPDGFNVGKVNRLADSFLESLRSGDVLTRVTNTVARAAGMSPTDMEAVGYIFNPDTETWELETGVPTGAGVGGTTGINDVGFGRNLARGAGGPGGGGSATLPSGVGGIDPRLFQSRQSFD